MQWKRLRWCGLAALLGLFFACSGGGNGADEEGGSGNGNASGGNIVPIGSSCFAGTCGPGLSCMTNSGGVQVCAKACQSDADCASGTDGWTTCQSCPGVARQCSVPGAGCGPFNPSTPATGTRGVAESCTLDSQCASGLRCMERLGSPTNRECLKPCAGHAACSGQPRGYTSCWSCDDDVFGAPAPGEGHCVNLDVCRTSSVDACGSCLDACRGLPSCCTGTGCICDSDC